ncbi:MAG TPA: two-component regulator propeller domain-containing protein [Prolixibacteraceae bacterium]|nr:two-component regulator propeller domain-containing protein [Prolixibacteraceae bacterium]
MFKNLIISVLFFLFSLPLFAEFRTNVHSISRREGLSNGAVNTIVKDAEGYIWFGTWNGLNRYNGSNIVTYLPGNDSNSIHNHVIRELYPTSSGSIWMLTNKGLGRYDNILDRFTSYFTKESEQMNYENDISICHSDSYGTLAAVFGRGVFRFDSITKQFSKIAFDKTSQPVSLTVKRIHVVNNVAYCITGSSQLMKISGNRLEEMMKFPLTGTLSSSISVLINQRPLILITQRSGAALMVDLITKNVLPLHIPDDIITAFSLSKEQNRLWVGTEKGKIYSFNLLTHDFEIYNILSDQLLRNPIASRILSIYETDSDVLWIGTDGNGVFTLKLTEFPSKSLSSSQLTYPIVRSILLTQKRDVLIGTKGGGIDVFDANGKHVRNISVKNGLSNNSVLSFLENNDGSIWVGTDGKGVDIISPDYRTIRNFPRDFEVPSIMDFGSVYRILEDSDQRIYLGTSGSGVIMIELDIKNGVLPVSCEQLVLDKSIANEGKQKQIVYALAEEKPGIIWIGTRGLGVYRYNTITKRVMAQYSTTSHPNLDINDDILSLFSSHKGRIWAGSSNGIFNLLPLSNDSVQVVPLKIQSDLSNTSIHALQRDNLGGLWVTTNQGISLIDSSRNNIRSFNVNDGLINDEYSDGASYFDAKTGKLYAGGTLGVDIIQTDAIKFSSYFPPISINQLLIKNLPAEIGNGNILTSRINHQKNLKLKYNQNSLTFYVSPLAYWGQERYKIAYRLIKANNEWIINPQNQPINFSNIAPGNYKFQLRVSDENGNWSNNIREIEITVDPPFWLTSWAIAGYIFLVIAIQLLIFAGYRRRAERKKELVLQEFQKKKDEELQSYKIEFFTNVAHEFRTPLTLITSHIHALLEDPQLTIENPRLLKVYNNSIKLQKLVLEIMQFRKLEKGKEPLNIQLTRPVELIREVFSDLELLAQQRNIACEVITPNAETEFKTDADKFQRIVTNLISNAIKYNKPGGFAKATIQSYKSTLIVEIEDNGVGVNPAYMHRVFEPFGISSATRKGSFPGYRSTGLGLAVTKGLVELLKGTINFESRENEGTKFTCVFPDVHELNSIPALNEPADKLDEINFMDETSPDQAIANSEKMTEKPLILLVDDEPEILVLLSDFLQTDYNILFATNGREAYEKVLSDQPDLVVSDVMMPEMDGIELCGLLRDNFDTSHLPIILLTAKAEIEDRIAGLKAGADSYIPKPFHPEHLKVRIEKLLKLRYNIRHHFGTRDSNPTLVAKIPDPFFQKLISYIDENIDDETLSSETLCDKLAISKSSLYNKTRSILGTTPNSMINQRRLSKAVILLRSTTLTVSEIIDQTGIASRTHFYALFNKAYGCSPSDYRNKAGE